MIKPLAIIILPVLAILAKPAQAELAFTEVSRLAGASIEHEFLVDYGGKDSTPLMLTMGGGVAAGDYDNDGDIDLYVLNADRLPNVLLQNNGSGQFQDVAEAAGVGLGNHLGNGPVFADFDADGWLDLVVGGIEGSGMRLLRNNADGTFTEVTESAGIALENERQNDWSSAFGDPDGDGDLDLYVGHWGVNSYVNHFWVNVGGGRFVAGDQYSGIDKAYPGNDWSFAPGFGDVDGDGRQDMVVASDFSSSHTLINRGQLHFEDTTTEVIDDRNGMGSALGDFDNDGDLDWFVTSIWYGDGSENEGNRLYANDGQGNFTNVTDQAGVIDGDWGWSACAQDFNNDGWLDLFHVNGMVSEVDPKFESDLSRLFINRGDGTFEELGQEAGIVDREHGRGLVCFDADNDGDIDLFTFNVFDNTDLWRNDLEPNPGWLQVKLAGEPDNPSAVGAVIRIRTGERWQMREVRVGSNYLSQDPLLQHFGLGGAAQVDELRVKWPHGGETVLEDVAPNQRMVLSAMDARPAPFGLQPGMSAAWYDPAHNGEGFVLELLEDGRVVLYWFSYDGDGNQDWYFAIGEQKGRRLLFPELLRLSGGVFGPGFDPDKVTREVVGSAAFTFTSCHAGIMDWAIDEDMGRQELTRLTRIAGVGCGKRATVHAEGEGLGGSWYDPAHDGEGYVLEILEDGRALVYWFSYGPDGSRRWFYGVGALQEGVWVFEDVMTTAGGTFGAGFDPATVTQSRWGRLELELTCDGGEARYDSSEAGFGSGVLQLTRLTSLQSLNCD